jgi:hypothetical protein
MKINHIAHYLQAFVRSLRQPEYFSRLSTPDNHRRCARNETLLILTPGFVCPASLCVRCVDDAWTMRGRCGVHPGAEAEGFRVEAEGLSGVDAEGFQGLRQSVFRG